jgi:hypothetical protein
MLEYASERLESVGRGSSRATFILTPQKVLKIAGQFSDRVVGSDAGMAQNETEVSIFTDPKCKPVVAKIFDSDPEYRWLISELVRPIRTRTEWSNLAGCDLGELSSAMMDLQAGNSREDVLKLYKKVDPKWLEVFVHLEQDFGLNTEDLARPGQWGKTNAGRLVILDYGFSYDVAEEHYDMRRYEDMTGSGQSQEAGTA